MVRLLIHFLFTDVLDMLDISEIEAAVFDEAKFMVILIDQQGVILDQLVLTSGV
jgi:hypothetical protein